MYKLDVKCSKMSVISDYKRSEGINNDIETTQQAENIFALKNDCFFVCFKKRIESNRNRKKY